MSLSFSALPKRAVSFVQEARQELSAVQWPSRQSTVQATAVVLVVSTLVAVLTGAADAILTVLVERLLLS